MTDYGAKGTEDLIACRPHMLLPWPWSLNSRLL